MGNKNIVIIGAFCKSRQNPQGGTEKYIYSLCKLFKKLGIDFNCIVLHSDCICPRGGG